jgi:prophage regulatory protein
MSRNYTTGSAAHGHQYLASPGGMEGIGLVERSGRCDGDACEVGEDMSRRKRPAKPVGELSILISLNQVAMMTSMSRTMVNKYRASGRFPDSVDLGDRRVAFVKTEVLEWIEEKIAARQTRDRR